MTPGFINSERNASVGDEITYMYDLSVTPISVVLSIRKKYDLSNGTFPGQHTDM